MSMHSVPSSRGNATKFDGFAALDECHGSTLVMLDALSDLLSDLEREGVTDGARYRAARIVEFFSTTSRDHHADEEHHVFARVLKSSPRHTQIVLRLIKDHDRLEELWLTLAPQLIAVAGGLKQFDLSLMQDAVPTLVEQYRRHMTLEESILYPAAISRMSVTERELMWLQIARHHGARAYQADRLSGLGRA